MTSISTFLDECRDVARLRHLAYSTEQSYIATIRRFIYFHERQYPTKLGVEEIRAYLTHRPSSPAGGARWATRHEKPSCPAGQVQRLVRRLVLPEKTFDHREKQEVNASHFFSAAGIKERTSSATLSASCHFFSFNSAASFSVRGVTQLARGKAVILSPGYYR